MASLSETAVKVSFAPAAWAPGGRPSRAKAKRRVPGVLPGRIGSWLDARLGGPLHAAVATALDLQPDDDLLDVGCGVGALVKTDRGHLEDQLPSTPVAQTLS